MLERFVEDVEFVEVSFDEEGNNDEIDKKCSEFKEINEDVLIPESMVGLADFLDVW